MSPALPTPYQRALRFTRTSDRKVFHVTLYGHWTDIRSEDGETDCIKWFGDSDYISNQKGFTYVKTIAEDLHG